MRQAVTRTPRSSSLVENLNSRLRNYFTLRRHLGSPYLDLLRFFLNQRRYMRILLTELSYRTDEYLAAHRRFVEQFAEEYGGTTGAHD